MRKLITIFAVAALIGGLAGCADDKAAPTTNAPSMKGVKPSGEDSPAPPAPAPPPPPSK